MSVVEKVSLGLVILFLLVAAMRLFKTPLKIALRVIINSALGYGALYLVNLTTALTGISIGMSLCNILVIGVLGIPGFFLLFLLQWVLL